MKYNTRFNPTVNGPLHLGHLYNVLVNYHEARRSGGKFIIRYDDTQRSWNRLLGPDKVAAYKNQILDDLAWFGIEPDAVSSQSEMMPTVEELLHYEFSYHPDVEHYGLDLGSELAGSSHHFYPYTERLTCEKVVMDMLDTANWLIRGLDLITEDCLYKHFCAIFKIHEPRMTYIPRLYFKGDTISKTSGQYKIEKFRQVGFDPKRLMSLLAGDCLINPDGLWLFENVKPQPALSNLIDEVLAS